MTTLSPLSDDTLCFPYVEDLNFFSKVKTRIEGE